MNLFALKIFIQSWPAIKILVLAGPAIGLVWAILLFVFPGWKRRK